MNRWRASLYVLTGAICYGSASTITKLGFLQGFTPAEISSGQVMLGCSILWLFALPYVKTLKTTPVQIILLVILTGVVWGLTEVCYTVSLSKIPASIDVILLFQFTWMTQIVQMVQTKTRLNTWQWVALASIMLGTFLASGLNTSDFYQLDMVGVILGLCSAISYTASIFISGTVALHLNPLLKSSLSVSGQMLFIFLVFPPTSLLTNALQQGLWIWIGLLAIIGIVATTFTYNKGIPHIGSGLAGILGSIELPMVLFFATTILQERVTNLQWIGAGMILLGIILSSLVESTKVRTESIHPMEQ